ncbi:MAG: DUF3536 domain-containing protein [Chloroflexota bacterium]
MGLSAFSVHGHFYQPPREDPTSGRIPLEPSAAPFHNWNERIHSECYLPNAELQNFARISFNIGPTLFSWLNAYHPDTAARIVAQDRANTTRFGVGNALAQAYNHTILPLGSLQDKLTQVYWGIADFEAHFGRRPQGLWLPETAVDLETLEVLARLGLQFTILAPWQANREIDATEPYSVPLPGGREISVFFYQRELSGLISFDPGVTINADHFVQHNLQPRFNPEKQRRGEPQLVLLASDGELYGHHQQLRDRFLARLVDGAASSRDLQPTYPALWLQQHPARQQVGIREATSWSCHHGVGRWTGACPCTPPDPQWKVRLWQAVHGLAQALDEQYFAALQPLVNDPWLLRHHYIHVMLGRMTLNQLLAEHTQRTLTSPKLVQIGSWLEAQRERQRMFTSCGWFFEDFDRIEPKNNLAYAARAIQLARAAGADDLAPAFERSLAGVASQLSGLRAEQVFAACRAN